MARFFLGSLKQKSADQREERSAGETRLCRGQRGAATTTEDVLYKHGFRVGLTGSHGQEKAIVASKENNDKLLILQKLYSQLGHSGAHYKTLGSKKTVQEITRTEINLAIPSPHLLYGLIA
jgi:hypothetical protein